MHFASLKTATWWRKSASVWSRRWHGRFVPTVNWRIGQLSLSGMPLTMRRWLVHSLVKHCRFSRGKTYGVKVGCLPYWPVCGCSVWGEFSHENRGSRSILSHAIGRSRRWKWITRQRWACVCACVCVFWWWGRKTWGCVGCFEPILTELPWCNVHANVYTTAE